MNNYGLVGPRAVDVRVEGENGEGEEED